MSLYKSLLRSDEQVGTGVCIMSASSCPHEMVTAGTWEDEGIVILLMIVLEIYGERLTLIGFQMPARARAFEGQSISESAGGCRYRRAVAEYFHK